jgi:hypothetical protein
MVATKGFKSSRKMPTLTDTPARKGEPNARFQDVDRVTNSHGITVLISQHRWGGNLTCALFREYPGRDGEIVRTAFIPESMMKAASEILVVARERMFQLRKSGTLPFPVLED